MRYAARTDGNQSEIVEAMRAVGASVYVLKLPVDLMVGYNNRTSLVEIKDPSTPYGKKGANANQAKFMATWNGGAVALIDSVEAAMRLIKVMGAA